ncbi:MAG: linear amide C-N hydrolase [Ruminococcus sp.]|nr:linear amide C-N hydrolase [Ruminococcus sp.]
MKRIIFLISLSILAFSVSGCCNSSNTELSEYVQNVGGDDAIGDGYGNMNKNSDIITLDDTIVNLEKGLSAVKYEGDYGFDEFLKQGGAESDSDVVTFLSENVLSSGDLSFGEFPFGCSTVSVNDPDGNFIFGRNFDWDNCNAMIVQSVPENGYASISTVNTDFINMSGLRLSQLPDTAQAVICLYAPLDGMNEMGLAVSVNMIQDSATISQNSDKPDITTTTAIRLLLDKAANVDEALELLEQYDMHASMGYMTHLAIADTNGRSVAVEYINNEMVVIETPVVTNFYLADGDKYGIGTEQSHERYDILNRFLSENKTADMSAVRDALDSVSKDNFNEFESTEWSVVFNQSTGEVHYFHRENYDKKYVFSIKQEGV